MARIGTLLASLSNSTGSVIVNRFYVSGLTAVAMAAGRIRVGKSDVMIATSIESMNMVPMIGNPPSVSLRVFMRDENVGIAYGVGLTVKRVVQQWKIPHKAQDVFSLASHQKALVTQQVGEFKNEITPVEIIGKFPDLSTGAIDIRTRTMLLGEGPCANTSVKGLDRLCVTSVSKGSATTGNSSQMPDGSGALTLMSERILKQLNPALLTCFVSSMVRDVSPEIMEIGPEEAIPAILKTGSLTQDQIDQTELSKTFATQSLAMTRDLGLDTNRINLLSGAIALGHPLGATGVVRTATMVHGLCRHDQRYGMVMMCTGTGMGAAGIFERIRPHVKGED